jgi:hypothetical protein
LGKGNTFFLGGAFRKAKNEIRRRKARAGKNFFPPTPFLFARPSVQVLRAKRAIIQGFAQKMFELRSKNTAANEMSEEEERANCFARVGMRTPERCFASRRNREVVARPRRATASREPRPNPSLSAANRDTKRTSNHLV